MPRVEAKRTYTGLDLVRFAAAISVALYHLSFWWWLPGAPHPPAAMQLFRWGWVGVQVFFVLSGFVIAYSAEGRSARQFVKGRAQRLYPAAWICATITLVTVGGALPEFARSALLWPTGPWISGVYWTLGIELAFYALIAVALAAGWKLDRVAIALGLASCAFWCVRAGVGLGFKSDLLDGQYANLSLLPHGCFFAIGMALWVLAQGRSWKMLGLIALCVPAGMIQLAAARHSFIVPRDGFGPQWADAPLLWLVAVAAIVAATRWTNAPGWLSGAARTAGLMTYPLYLVHKEVGDALMLRLIGLGPVPALLFSLGAMILLAFAVVGVERGLKALAPLHAPRRSPAADLP